MAALYDTIGKTYSLGRRSDQRIAKQLNQHLIGARNILNIGAGTGSYEPDHAPVIAIEPSAEMLNQRAPDAHPAIQGSAESLPFENKSFSHSLTILSMHHWQNRAQAFNEIKRVTSERFVALSWSPDAKRYWLTADYFPEIHDIDQAIFPTKQELKSAFPGIKFSPLLIPADCIDGFTAAFWARPEAYLQPQVRQSMSTFSKIKRVREGITKLKQDLESGHWQQKHGEILRSQSLDAGYFIASWQA